jgi:hypothetical protein
MTPSAFIANIQEYDAQAKESAQRALGGCGAAARQRDHQGPHALQDPGARHALTGDLVDVVP